LIVEDEEESFGGKTLKEFQRIDIRWRWVVMVRCNWYSTPRDV